MSDYAVAAALDRIANQFAALAKAQAAIAQAMNEKNKIEVAQQKREWLARGLSKDSFSV